MIYKAFTVIKTLKKSVKLKKLSMIHDTQLVFGKCRNKVEETLFVPEIKASLEDNISKYEIWNRTNAKHIH